MNQQPASRYFLRQSDKSASANPAEDAWADIATAICELEWIADGAQKDESIGRIVSQAWRAMRYLQKGK